MGQFQEIDGLHVTVDQVVYAPELPSPPDQPHSFVYFISIRNDSEQTVTIKARKWVVTDANGVVTAVEGDGVVGEMPILEPGEKFSYNSRQAQSWRRPLGERRAAISVSTNRAIRSSREYRSFTWMRTVRRVRTWVGHDEIDTMCRVGGVAHFGAGSKPRIG